MTPLRFKRGMSAPWENLSDPLFAHAANRPDWPAVIDGPTILTYRALAELVAKTSVYLHDIGIGIGDRVGVNLSSGVDHVVLMLGLLRAGATLTEIHYSSATRPDFGMAAAPRHREALHRSRGAGAPRNCERARRCGLARAR